MRALSVNITIGNYQFRHAASVEIQSAWDMLSDTCQIQLPALGRFSGNPGKWQEVSIKPGDAVSVELGYDGVLVKEFEGYVSSFEPRIPYTIMAEGAGYLLKRSKPIKKSYKSVTLKALLAEMLQGFNVTISDSVPDVELSPFVIASATPAEVLQKLAGEYIFAAYFRGSQLFVGLPYTEGTPLNMFYDLQKVVSADGLKFKTADQVKLKAKAVSILKNNARLEASVGDADGEQRTLFFRGITNQDALKKMAEAELAKLKYDGYEGSFDAFGTPYISHSYSVDLQDKFFPERSGRYVVDQVKTTFGTSGFRRSITIGKKL